MTIDLSSTTTPPLSWRDRICARLGGLCELLRRTHEARIPF